MPPLVNTQPFYFNDAVSFLLMESWNERLIEHMAKRGMSQRTLAPIIGITQAGVSHWLTKRVSITLIDFMRLCSAAGANPQRILFGTAPTTADLTDNITKMVGKAPTHDLFKWRTPKKRKTKSKSLSKKPLDLDNYGEYSDVYSEIGGDK